MIRVAINNRQLIWNFVARDLRGRYVGSMMGVFWNILNPLILLATYTLVFGYVMKARIPPGLGTNSFPVFLFSGMIPWIAFSESVMRSTTAISDNSSLVKKVSFPPEILVLYIAISSFVHELLALSLFLILMGFTGISPGLMVVFLPFVFAAQLVFTVGIALFLASLNVYIRDISHLIGAILQVFFFVTPICYPLESVPSRMKMLMGLNPVSHLVEMYRDILLRNQLHSLKGTVFFVATAALVFLAGTAVFSRAKKGFADLI